MEEPEGWKKLVLLCRDKEGKIYFMNRMQKMNKIQAQIDYAAQLMLQMAQALNNHEPNCTLMQKFKEWTGNETSYN